MPATNSLRQLHLTHQQLEDARQQLERGPIQIKARESIVRKREQDLVDYHAELKRQKMFADSKSLDLNALEKKIVDLKVKLNSASSNREFDIFKEQIRADEMAMSVLEDEILEIIDRVDTETAKQADYEQAVVKAKEELDSFRSQFESKSRDLQDSIKDLERHLASLESLLPSEPKQQYRRLVASRGAKAMSAVSNGACGNCYVNLTAQQRIQIKTGIVLFCSSCGSLLYIDETL
ncbi:zinc ribbon domain-containing protein [Rubinisphaera margarita]|uniref:zinc ribbon domain-containing protein n=1 Tax=Rubinisphaera margarita TaxID=2909586 RepID=UPI001EE96ED2|nr:hypothetical protein [Rubinisphaera margarita]MCG6158053.1 hypothetical protein [Rubinisphaera margarita]